MAKKQVNVVVLDETVFADGSGVSGLYEVWGQKYSGIHTGDRDKAPTVTPLGITDRYRSRREKEIVSTGCKHVAAHVQRVMEGFWSAQSVAA